MCNEEVKVFAYVFWLYWAIFLYPRSDLGFSNCAVTKLILFHSKGKAVKRGSKCLDAFGKGRPERWFTPPATSTLSPDSAKILRPTTVSFYSTLQESNAFKTWWIPVKSLLMDLASLTDKCPPTHRHTGLTSAISALPQRHLVQINISINSRKWTDVYEFVIDCIQ